MGCRCEVSYHGQCYRSVSSLVSSTRACNPGTSAGKSCLSRVRVSSTGSASSCTSSKACAETVAV